MRVLVLVKATPESEAQSAPKPEDLEEMGKFNDKITKAGVMLAADGLRPSSDGKKVKFAAAGSSVIDGPFTETKELVAGFWIWQVASMEEAVEWLRQAPFSDTEVEIRPIWEFEDFKSQAQ